MAANTYVFSSERARECAHQSLGVNEVHRLRLCRRCANRRIVASPALTASRKCLYLSLGSGAVGVVSRASDTPQTWEGPSLKHGEKSPPVVTEAGS